MVNDDNSNLDAPIPYNIPPTKALKLADSITRVNERLAAVERVRAVFDAAIIAASPDTREMHLLQVVGARVVSAILDGGKL